MTQYKFDPSAVKIGLVRGLDDISLFMDWIETQPVGSLIGYDVETDGLNWYDGKLRLVQFGNETEGFAIPYEVWPGLVKMALEVCDKREYHLCGHNFRFDLLWTWRHVGWEPSNWGRIHDTMISAALVNSIGPKDLKTLAEIHVHPIAKLGQQKLKDAMDRGGWVWGTVPWDLPEYFMYGVLDTILDVHLHNRLMERMQALGVMEAYRLHQAETPALFKMERKGLLLDSEHCRIESARLGVLQQEILDEVGVKYGITNVSSGPQLVAAMQRAGIELTKLTDSKKSFAMDRDTLEEIAAITQHPLPNLITRYRKALKMQTSYYDSFIEYQRSDGRVHPSYRQLQARTYRMSATGPAIQTIPRPHTDPEVRNSFIAPEGSVLISTDFTNIEARIFADFAKEHGMLDAIRSGVDLHCYTAMRIFGLAEMPSKSDPLRQIAKNTLFTVLFGGGPTKIAITAGITVEAAQIALKGLYAAFPGIKAYQKKMERQAKESLNDLGIAMIRLGDGRMLRMAEDDDRYFAFCNWSIQGTARIVMAQALRSIEAAGLSDYCIATIHDEVVAEVPVDEAEEFSHAISEAMTDNDQFLVPIEAEAGKPAVRLGDAK